jgi:O-antigen ligase
MEASAASRLGIAEANLRMFADHPLGVGHRGNDLLSPQYMAPELLTEAAGVPIRSAHNVVLAVLVDHGLIGLLLILMLHVQIVRSLLRLHRLPAGSLSLQMAALCAALGTALVIYWVNAQFANMLKAEIVIWIAALAAALETLPKNRLQDTLPLKQQRSPIHLQKLRH